MQGSPPSAIMPADLAQEERLSRTVVRQLDPPRGRKNRDRFTAAGIAMVLLLALVGVVSAGLFVAGKVGASSTTTKQHRQTTGNPVSVADLNRAQAQATALIRTAEEASNSIVRSATKNAHRQASAIVAAARRQARRIAAAAPTAVPAVPTAVAPIGTGNTVAGGAIAGTGTQFGTVPTTVYPTATPLAGSTLGNSGAPNLGGVPPSWLVVGYNATFGSGPGTAGSISVLNRGRTTFSGIAVVQYTRGGFASAPFSALAPGQSLTLPLNGRPYTGGGYRIVLQALR
jgi:hypothetical protein